MKTFSVITSCLGILASAGCSSGGGGAEPRALPQALDCTELLASPAYSGTSEDSSADACFHPERFAKGAKAQLSYRSTTPSCRDLDVDQEVLGQRLFNGQASVETQLDIADSSQPTLVSQDNVFNQVDEAVKTVKTLGYKTLSQDENRRTETTATYEPARMLRFDLASGDSYQQSYALTTESKVTIAEPQVPVRTSESRRTSTVDETVSFEGIETLSLTGRSFEACRYSFETITTADDGAVTTENTTEWYHSQTGVLVKSQNDGSAVRVLSLGNGAVNTVDGTALR